MDKYTSEEYEVDEKGNVIDTQNESNDSVEMPEFMDSNAAYLEAEEKYKNDLANETEEQEENEKKLVSKIDKKNEDKTFDEYQKMSAEQANNMNPKRKPKVLNKNYILAVIVSVFCLIIVLSFLLPSDGAKNAQNEKEQPVAYTPKDYSLYAQNPELTEEDLVFLHYEEDEKPSSPVKKEVEIPPFPNTDPQPYTPQTTRSTTVAAAPTIPTITIPDTRNDSLRGKSILGIKGLTSTQSTYSTDYYDTIQKNTTQTQLNNEMPSREEFIQSALSQYASYMNPNQGNAYAMQNDQSGKLSFYNQNQGNAGKGEWLNLNTLWEGSIFEATLVSAMNTDLPGEIVARVSKNIYSSQDGRFLLIPQNSLLFGSYNSSISYAQSRAQIQWNTLIRPDGYKISLGGMNATDAQGASGIKGFVNDHPLAYLKAIALLSTVSIVNGEFVSSIGATDNEYVKSVLADTQRVTNQLGEKLIDRAMNVQPTIKIKEGTKINIVVNQTLTLPPVAEIPVTQNYIRFK